LAARIDRVQPGRTVNFRVMLGPYNTVNDADSALRQAIDAGVTDAKIVVE
jgi:cell division protein FtsN